VTAGDVSASGLVYVAAASAGLWRLGLERGERRLLLEALGHRDSRLRGAR
jgi:hypothetical protein